jgi:hypothetical protein
MSRSLSSGAHSRDPLAHAGYLLLHDGQIVRRRHVQIARRVIGPQPRKGGIAQRIPPIHEHWSAQYAALLRPTSSKLSDSARHDVAYPRRRSGGGGSPRSRSQIVPLSN